MATILYPTNLDTSANTNGRMSSTDLMTGGSTYGGPEVIDKIYTEIEALQTKVGVNSSNVTSSIDYLLKNSSSIDPGHKHTNIQGINNTAPVQQKDTGGTLRNVANVDNTNILNIGDASLAGFTFLTPTPKVRLRMGSNVTVTTSAETAIPWDVEIEKVLLTHSNSSNKSRIYITLPGDYLIFSRLNWTTGGTGVNALYLWVNGVEQRQFAVTSFGGLAGSIPWTFALNDYLEIYIYQDTGTNKIVDFGTNSYNTYLDVIKIH